MDRRQFLRNSTAATAATLAVGNIGKAQPSERVQVGVMGAGGRALSLIRTFASNREVEVVAIADIDSRRLPQAVAEVQRRQNRRPTTTDDFRRLIENRQIDALVIGTPDHWHAIPTIMACAANKDVYVEKPDGHNMEEGKRMVAAMRRHRRIVQMGSQHRSTTRLQSALAYIGTGALGRCTVAKAWESTRQAAVPARPDGRAPAGVNYDMWMGPAPRRPFNVNRFHGRWRWFYDYGTGDLGNDGVHRLDMAFAALNAACRAQEDPPCVLPTSIFANGGKWFFDDAQQFPDTMQVNYEYGGRKPKLLTYEMRIWAPYRYHEEGEGAAVYGDRGYMVIGNNGWRAYDRTGRMVRQGRGDSHERPHVQNFIDCVKTRRTPACDLATVGHPASVLCHTGNIAARLGRKLTLDPQTETFREDREANNLRVRSEYRRPWLLPDV